MAQKYKIENMTNSKWRKCVVYSFMPYDVHCIRNSAYIKNKSGSDDKEMF